MQSFTVPIRRRWANHHVAREVDRDRVRWLWGVFAVMVLAAAPFAVYLLWQNECLGLAYEANALREEREQLIEEENRLRMQRATLESLDRIESWAVTRHGMVRPAPEQVNVVRRAPPGAVENSDRH